jgi:hypothetical protein
VIGRPFLGRSEPALSNRNPDQARAEEGSNTSNVALRVVGGDEKGNLESETLEYGHEPYINKYATV